MKVCGSHNQKSLPSGCYDFILGSPFLKTMSPILWDFNKLQMEFKFKGKKFVLRGAKQKGAKVNDNKALYQAIQ